MGPFESATETEIPPLHVVIRASFKAVDGEDGDAVLPVLAPVVAQPFEGRVKIQRAIVEVVLERRDDEVGSEEGEGHHSTNTFLELGIAIVQRHETQSRELYIVAVLTPKKPLIHRSVYGLTVVEIAAADARSLQLLPSSGYHPGLKVNSQNPRAKSTVVISRPLLHVLEDFAVCLGVLFHHQHINARQ